MFSVDISVCPVCCGPLTVIAYLTDPRVVNKILTHLRLPTTPPPLAPARDPEQQLDLAFDDLIDADDLAYRASPRSRAPPSTAPPSSHDQTIDHDYDWGA